MPNYGKFLKELVNNKQKIEQISAAFLSDESSAILQNKVPAKLRDPKGFLIPCNFNKAFSYNALADLGASINLMLYSLYAKLSLETLKPTKMSVRLADRSFEYPVGIAENMLVEVGKFTYPADFVILEMEENSFSIDVIDEILEEDFDALLDEEPPTDLELKPLPDNMEYVLLEEPSFLPVIISSQLSEENQNMLISILPLQEFDIEIKDRKGTENVAADHLSQIENEETSDDSEVNDNFPGETLMEINT
ncbi:reverse transcriptase domain-containing protein [Tanacetum coccineum]